MSLRARSASLRRLLRGLSRRRRPAELPPREAYRRWAASYGEEPNELQRLEAETLGRLLPECRGATVLDLGCGKGRLAAELLRRGARRALAADAVLAMLADRAARRDPGIRRLASATHPLPFRGQSFDLVACALVLGHVEDLGGALAEIARVLIPGGRLVLSDFHPDATRRGWRRTFRDRDGRSRAIAQHLHPLADYRRLLAGLRLELEALEEPCWHGQPVAFVLRARKPESSRRLA